MERTGDSNFPIDLMPEPISSQPEQGLPQILESDWHQQLRDRIQALCQYPPNSRERRQGFNQVVRMIQQSGKLWRSSTPYYEDALQDTWLHFSRNLCEATTAEHPYCAADCAVMARLNAYLKRRLQDYAVRSTQEQQQREPPRRLNDGSLIDPVEQLQAAEAAPPILEAVQAWVAADPTGELQATHIQGKPIATCQYLILRRLPPETPWKVIAAELGISIATLSGFYEKQCRPRLRRFGESEGYL